MGSPRPGPAGQAVGYFETTVLSCSRVTFSPPTNYTATPMEGNGSWSPPQFRGQCAGFHSIGRVPCFPAPPPGRQGRRSGADVLVSRESRQPQPQLWTVSLFPRCCRHRAARPVPYSRRTGAPRSLLCPPDQQGFWGPFSLRLAGTGESLSHLEKAEDTDSRTRA